MSSLLEGLADGRRIEEPVALVAAHPDDEVVGLGSRLACFADLTLIHLTNGSPRDPGDAIRAGFAAGDDYAAARAAELDAALDLLDVRAKRISYRLPDQEAAHRLPELVARLRADLAGTAAVFTHPYEHGHPDHDSAALAVSRAAPGLQRFEFACYHLGQEGAAFGRFWLDRNSRETVIHLSPEAQAAKADALACFATQAETLAQFPLGTERVRPAPVYDFSRPAPPGSALYEQWDFAENAAAWRTRAAQALAPPLPRAGEGRNLASSSELSRSGKGSAEGRRPARFARSLTLPAPARGRGE